MFNIYNHLILIVLLLFSACAQESSSLHSEIDPRVDAVTSSPACQSVDLHKDLLKQENALSLFECLGWDREFSHTFSALKELDRQEFNAVTGPLNTTFFATSEKRDQFFDLIVRYAHPEDINHLEQSLKNVLLHPKIFVALGHLVTNASQEGKLKILPPRSIITFLEERAVEFIKGIDQNRLNLSLLQDEVAKEHPEIKTKLLKLFESLLLLVSEGEGDNLKRVERFLFHSKGFLPWLKQMNASQYYDIAFYSVDKLPRLTKNVESLEKYISLEESLCENSHSSYVVKHKREYVQAIDDLRKKNHGDFLSPLIEAHERLSFYRQVCPENSYHEDLRYALNTFHHFIDLPGGYSIIQRMVEANYFEGNENPETDILGLYTNSEVKKYFDLLIDLKNTHYDEKYNELFFNLLQGLDEEDLLFVKDALHLLLEEKEWLSQIYYHWTKLSLKDRLALSELFYQGFYAPYLLERPTIFLRDLLKEFSDVVSSFQSYAKNPTLVSQGLTHFSEVFSDAEIHEELSRFLSVDSFFKLLTLFTQKETESLSKVEAKEDVSEEAIVASIKKPSSSLMKDQMTLVSCAHDIVEIVNQSAGDLWTLFQEYPRNCKEVQNKDLVGKIFDWTLIVDSIFLNSQSRLFSVPYGTLSSEMLQFYISTLLTVEKQLDHQGDYIKKTLDVIIAHLKNYDLIGVLDDVVTLVNSVEGKSSFLDDLTLRMANADIQKANANSLSLLKLLSKPPQKITETLNEFDCSYLNRRLVYEGAVEEFTLCNQNAAINMLNLLWPLLEKETDSMRLTDAIVELLHPQIDISIPFNHKKASPYRFDLIHAFEFLYDITDENKKWDVEFWTSKSDKAIENLLMSERLEIVIKEIGFIRNYYGAFFMNNTSSAKDYAKKVKALKKSLKLAKSMEWVFRRTGAFPEKTAWAFKNILNTYDSLYEIDTEYGTEKEYGKLIQALLTTVVRSSQVKSQDFGSIKKPNPELVANHQGRFITHMTEFSFMTHVGKFLRAQLPNGFDEIKNDKKWQKISGELLGKMSLDKMKELLNYFIASGNGRLIVEDFIVALYSLEKPVYEKTILGVKEILYFMAEQLEDGELDVLLPVMKKMVDYYPLIKKEISKEFDSQNVVQFLQWGIEKFRSLKKDDKRGILNSLREAVDFLNTRNLDSILGDELIVKLFAQVLKKMINYSDHLDENGIFALSIFQKENFTLVPLFKMLQGLKQKNDRQYIRNIFSVLGEKVESSENRTRLRLALEEVFSQGNKERVIEFLDDLIFKFELAPQN